MKLVFLWTDLVVFTVIAATVFYAFKVARTPHLSATWRKAFASPSGAAAATILSFFVLVGVIDSFHYRLKVEGGNGSQVMYGNDTHSLLDSLMARQEAGKERSYSAPLAYQGFEKSAEVVDGQTVRRYPRLVYGGTHLQNPESDWAGDITRRSMLGVAQGLLLIALLTAALVLSQARRQQRSVADAWHALRTGQSKFPLRTVLVTLGVMLVLGSWVHALAAEYHVFGTDRVGGDLLFVVLKSIRTALVIGTMSTLVTMPIAVGLGILAGYLRGWVDEVIQYVYTVINSIPYVLMIAAMVLILMVFIDNHADIFQTAAERTDARLFFLCVILGMTSWTDLCRLIRGEVIKLREAEYIQAAQAFGVSTWRILSVHLLPNVMHLILISMVINFSGLVLAEAVLSYIGIGVDPAMQSFGTLINTARLELSREPTIWWTLATAFTFMFGLVLSANIFSDAIRDAFDPRAIHK